ncbi:uncharacterized protein A1O9_05129 [Exophiala aquamarina CBS 119918]|uniref:D-serine dehydratase n=1 Tax=Exophiala aquamarina CBS 119918 TaxID=1182545 RepID=A0A072PJN2_9EURO|nr:uncharacterized protein A1O9_05129 [Exophiala aquamarina CBS 119918]KEF60279.1 hypothetical protein A1O9_05129 [Exophiala aquamarina CBS 119918]
MSSDAFPLSARDGLLKAYRNRLLQDLPVPSAIIDVAKVKENCTAMLNAVKELDVSFRAHIKTHKTAEMTKLQVGENCKDVRLVVSTVIEAEHVVPLLLEYKQAGAKVNVLYALPLAPSQVSRLASVAKSLGEGAVSVMIDDLEQFKSLKEFHSQAGFPASVFLKTDCGYHRAGLGPGSQEMINLVQAASEGEEQGLLKLLGFYSHNSLSYGGSSPDDAMDMLKVEIDVCHQASKHFKVDRKVPLVVSVGASPTALSLQNILPANPATTSSATSLKESLELAKTNLELEIHAGVYPTFDIQQVATSSRYMSKDPHDTIAVSILTEVCSLYPSRTEQPEALISAGVLALAREACKDYPGWGVVTPWNMPKGYSIEPENRIIVNRTSQEHGILAWEKDGTKKPQLPLKYGQKLRIWPNHTCITLANFGWYLIVDSSTDNPDTVIDVWVRWRGW